MVATMWHSGLESGNNNHVPLHAVKNQTGSFVIQLHWDNPTLTPLKCTVNISAADLVASKSPLLVESASTQKKLQSAHVTFDHLSV